MASSPLRSRRATLAWSCFVILCCAVVPLQEARARAPGAECRAAGPPGELEAQTPSGPLSTLEYDGQHWIVELDRPKSPKRVRLLSSSGRSFELPSPPAFEPKQWFGRGRAIYGLGTSRSLEKDKLNVVVVRWGMDGRRPRTIRLWSQDGVSAGPTAVLSDDTLAVGWGAAHGGKSRWTVGTVSLERLSIGDAVAVGGPVSRAEGHLMTGADGAGFVSLWVEDGAVKVARFDKQGKITRKATEVPWKGEVAIAAAAQCGKNLYALDSNQAGEARLHQVGADGPREVARFAAAVDVSEMPLTCTGDAAVVGHRVWNDKAGSVVFWISTVDPGGKTRARRLKDLKGGKDDIRLPTFVGSGDELSAWWAQKHGARTSVYTRPIGCR